ncbi:hypothetical protein J4E89_003763 [Alternaria sp. Ai002NY15]|nr:hypothetical protein J4E89_003763 [Alternaria sp. Ai002NY15]
MPALLSADAMPEEEHNSDEVLGDAEGGEENCDAFEIPAAETYAHLPKPIHDNIHFCIQAIQTSHSEWKDAVKAIDNTFEAQRVSLEEQHALAKAQEVAFEKREATYIRLPTNQAVNLVHNALLTEHAHERVLIADMFRAVKIGKVDMRAARADGLKKAKEVHLRQRKTLSKLIEGLSGMAGHMKNERVVGERRLVSTGPALAVRSPTPASYSQTAARAPPITTSLRTQIGNGTALGGLYSRSGLMSELGNSPGASAATSTATIISVGQQRQIKVIIKAAIRRCKAERSLNLARLKQETTDATDRRQADIGLRLKSLALLMERSKMLDERSESIKGLAAVLDASVSYYKLFSGVTEERKHIAASRELVVSELDSDKKHYEKRTEVATKSYDSIEECLDIREDSLERLALLLGISLED